MPSATQSHLLIPAKIFTKITFTFLSIEISLKALTIFSGVAPPPTSKKFAGSPPANFLDVGGGATPEKIVKAFKLITMDKKVKVILVNIFAGINRCDWVAEGIVQALEKIEIKVPLVIRLAGTNVEKGNKILRDSKLNYIEANTLEDAANKAVKALGN